MNFTEQRLCQWAHKVNYLSELYGRLYWLLPHKHASPVSSSNKTHHPVANSNLTVHFTSIPALQHNSARNYLHSAPPLFPSTPLLFHPSIPNISQYTIRGCCEININWTHLLLKVLHMCHVLQLCVWYIIEIGSSWLPQFHSAQCEFSLWEWDHQGWPNYQLLDSCLSQWPYQQLPSCCWYSCPVHQHPSLLTQYKHVTPY